MVRITHTVNMIILNENNEILLLKRADDNDPNDDFVGFFCIPGGGVDENETYEKALYREIKEEIDCEIVDKVYFRSFYYVVNEKLHARCIYFYGKIKGNIKINEESEEFGWFNFNDILNNKVDLAFNHKDVLKEFIEFCKNK